MTRTVIARDQHCVFPGCRRKAHHSDLDHVDAYRPGDRTTTANLTSLCRRHHRLKHTGRWQLSRNDRTGITTWTDHHGRTYRSRPPERPTTTTASAATRPEMTSRATSAASVQLPTDPDPPPF